jgi:hypothetical protein
MFKGKAGLVDPENNTPVATFTEACLGDGTANMKVVLKAPMTVSGTERLAIYSTVKGPRGNLGHSQRRSLDSDPRV